MVLLGNTGSNGRRSNSSLEKANKLCFNFNKGSCRFGSSCKFLHNGVHGSTTHYNGLNTIPSNVLTSTDITKLQSLLAKLGFNGQQSGVGNSCVTTATNPIALHASTNSQSYYPGYSLTHSPLEYIAQPQAHFITPAQHIPFG